MTSAAQVRDVLAALGAHPDVVAVVEQAAERRGLRLAGPADGAVTVHSAVTARVAATVHAEQLYLPIDASLVRQVSDDIGWTVARRGLGTPHVTIRAQDLLSPAAQELAASLLEQAVVAAAIAPPPAPAASPRRTTTARSSSVPRARAAPPPARAATPARPEPPAAKICPTCFQEMLGGECFNCG